MSDFGKMFFSQYMKHKHTEIKICHMHNIMLELVNSLQKNFSKFCHMVLN